MLIFIFIYLPIYLFIQCTVLFAKILYLKLLIFAVTKLYGVFLHSYSNYKRLHSKAFHFLFNLNIKVDIG